MYGTRGSALHCEIMIKVQCHRVVYRELSHFVPYGDVLLHMTGNEVVFPPAAPQTHA